jgi:NTE family protein
VTDAAAITAFDLVFGLFILGVVVLLALVVPFILRNGAAARRAWEKAQREAAAQREADAAPRPVTALVLGGGGTRGAVQVGMLQVLAEHGFMPDRIYGASVGAVNGAGFAGDPTVAGVERITAIWRGIKSGDIYPQRLVHGPWQFLQQRPSVHPNTGLRRIIEAGLTFERIEDARVPFAAVATSLVDGSERWLTSGPAVEAILASAAIPAIFPPVELEGDQLVDGGIVDNVPVSRAIEDGASRVVVLLCGPLEYRPPPARRPVEVMLNALFVAIHARLTRELATVPPGVDVVVCSAGGTATRDYMDFSDTDELIDAGRSAALGILERLGLGSPGPGKQVATAPGEHAIGSSGPAAEATGEVAGGSVPPPSAGRGPSAASDGAPPSTSKVPTGSEAVPEPGDDATAVPGAGPDDAPVVGFPAVREVQRAVGRLRELVDDPRARGLLRSVPRSAQNFAARLPRVRIETGPPPPARAPVADVADVAEIADVAETADVVVSPAPPGAADSGAGPAADQVGQPTASPVSEGRSQPAPGR